MEDLLNKYLNPGKEIVDAVDKAEKLYQLLHLDDIDIYLDKKKQKGFSGTLYEYCAFEEISQLIDIKDDQFKTLFKAIFLVSNSRNQMDINYIAELDEKDSNIAFNIIRDGVKAQKEMKAWIEPLNGDCRKAISDGIKISLERFDIFKVEKISEPTDDTKIDLLNAVFEIENPYDVVEYIRLKSVIGNKIILTMQRDKVRYYRTKFIIFLLFEGMLYCIQTKNHRININNTAGDRNPDKWMDRDTEGMWLPFKFMYPEEDKDSKELAIQGRERFFLLITMEKLFETDPEIIYWLEIFTQRILEHISSEKENLKVACMLNENLKLLPGDSLKKAQEYKCEEKHGSGEYLLNIYKYNSKELTLVETALPALITTAEQREKIVEYELRKKFAKNIENQVWKRYEAEKDNFHKWLVDFLNSRDHEKIISKALEGKKYPFMHYTQFSDNRDTGINEDEILSRSPRYFGGYREKHNEIILEHPVRKNNYLTTPNCYLCNKHPNKDNVVLKFKDWQQFIAFFEIEKEQLPKVMIEHFHRQMDMYVGNSILDDLDPVDLIKDPWFRENGSYDANITICYRLCKICLNKIKKKIPIEEEEK